MKDYPTYPTYPPIIPIPGRIVHELAEKLDISYSLLYQIIRKYHTPSAKIRRRITSITNIPDTIWDGPHYEAIHEIYEWFRAEQAAKDQVAAIAEGNENTKEIYDLL